MTPRTTSSRLVDRAEIEQLYAEYGYAVHRRCQRILVSSAEADDAVQEVFIRVMRYGTPRGSGVILAWLYRIAERVCFDQLMKKRREGTSPEDTQTPDSTGEPTVRTDRESLHDAMVVLSRCRRSVQQTVLCYYVDQMTQDEVARALSCSRKTVRKRLARFAAIANQTFTGAPAMDGVG